MNSRLKPTWLKVTDATEGFTVEVVNYGISTEGKYGESDYIECDLDGIPRRIKLNQASLMYLATHKIAPSEENLKKNLPGKKLMFQKQKLGNFWALVVVGIVKGRSKT